MILIMWYLMQDLIKDLIKIIILLLVEKCLGNIDLGYIVVIKY